MTRRALTLDNDKNFNLRKALKMMNTRCLGMALILACGLIAFGADSGKTERAPAAPAATITPEKTLNDKSTAADRAYADARIAYSQILDAPGTSPQQKADARYLLAGMRSYDGAVIELKRALEARSLPAATTAPARAFLDKAAEAAGALDEGRRVYAKVLDAPGASPQQKADARMAIANMLFNAKRYADAGAEARHVLDAKDLSTTTTARAEILLGKCFFFEKDYASARNGLNKALAIKEMSKRDKVEASLYIGLTYYKEGDYARAKTELEKVLTMPGAGDKQTHEATLRLRLRKLIPGDEKVLTVLFIGASQTQVWNVPRIVEALAASAPVGIPRIVTGEYTRGGTGIQRFWEEGQGPETARDAIASDPWNFVVFETHPLLFGNDIFVKYATNFAGLVREKNATPVFFEAPMFMRYAYPDDYRKNHDETVKLANSLRVPVAAGNYAMVKYLGPTPTPAQRAALYHADAVHPSKQGSYLLACSIYAAITGRSPIGLTNVIPSFGADGISKEEATKLQEAAWKAFQETNAAQRQ